MLSHDYDVNISVCFAEPSRALFFGERKKNIVTMKRIMKLLIASALLLSLTKAAQSVKQDGKVHSLIKRISRVSTFPATKSFRHVLMKQFYASFFPQGNNSFTGRSFPTSENIQKSLDKNSRGALPTVYFSDFSKLFAGYKRVWSCHSNSAGIMRQRREYVQTKRL